MYETVGKNGQLVQNLLTFRNQSELKHQEWVKNSSCQRASLLSKQELCSQFIRKDNYSQSFQLTDEIQ